MLWLALHLPWLPLEALPAPSSVARCVVEQRRVLTVTRAARLAGVEAGLSAATAASLAPQVQQLPRDPQREAEFIRLLALALARYTPNLVLLSDGVLLEVSASLRLFGGLQSLLRQLRATVRECDVHARIAMAPTASGAALLSRMNRPRRSLRLARLRRLLDALPLLPALAALQQPERLAELLQTIGCRNLIDVRALPRAGLNKRGGGELLLALDRAYGDAPDPRAWFEPPERFSTVARTDAPRRRCRAASVRRAAAGAGARRMVVAAVAGGEPLAPAAEAGTQRPGLARRRGQRCRRAADRTRSAVARCSADHDLCCANACSAIRWSRRFTRSSCNSTKRCRWPAARASCCRTPLDKPRNSKR